MCRERDKGNATGELEKVGEGNHLRRVLRGEKKWCRFQISMKLEKTAVRAVRSNNGFVVSRDAMIGVRKCCQRTLALAARNLD